MSDIQLTFSPNSVQESGNYKLLELPPDLCTLVEASLKNASSPSLSIRGQAGEDAVLCTQEKTYSIRSIVLSNTILIVTQNSAADSSVVIRDQVNDILELVPCVPKLHKLDALLKGRTYDENQTNMDVDSEATGAGLTYGQIKTEIQASDGELQRALTDRRILIVNGELRPIAPGYLFQVLELLLNVLVSLSLPHDDAPIDELVSTLSSDHEVSQRISKQVMAWFGDIEGGKWKMDVQAVVKEMGLSLLREHRYEPIVQDLLLAKWKSCVGDTFESSVSLSLLAGNYIVSDGTGSDNIMFTYFPASELPVEPAARFADLFLVRPRWRGEEIIPFLSDIAVNTKERDKLLLKYCRAITDAGTAWYVARTQYTG